jgi:hypothetical protein
MSEKLVMQLIDAESGESTTRPFTVEEVENYEAMQTEHSATKANIDEIRSSAVAKLAALGLTEEEIAAL